MKELHVIHILEEVKKAFKVIAPFWPLKNFIAVNPLQGLEDLPFEQAMNFGFLYFEQTDFPDCIKFVNIQTIKWLQLYSDHGQATISMPLKKNGLYRAWKKLAVYDKILHQYDQDKQNFLHELSDDPEIALTQALLKLDLSTQDVATFLTLMITTLPGWASYVKYSSESNCFDYVYSIEQIDYLAIRVIITSLYCCNATAILNWYNTLEKKDQIVGDRLQEISCLEDNYRFSLLQKIAKQSVKINVLPQAQFIFCIDVRSERFRRSLEAVSDYATYGCAGFFGIPVKFIDQVTGKSYNSCPVLLSYKHDVHTIYNSSKDYTDDLKSYDNITMIKRAYQSLKYTFATGFCLVECLGFINLFWMPLLSFAPGLASSIKSAFYRLIRKPVDVGFSLENISFIDQCSYALSFLNLIALTDSFAPIVVLCGHKSSTYNNVYASALDCGACGGCGGGNNAALLASILNQMDVRNYLCSQGIVIPKTTVFIGAEHDTTTDNVIFYKNNKNTDLKQLEDTLKSARILNNSIRIGSLEDNISSSQALSHFLLRSQDWAQVRPEWGLAGNTAFIVGPRDITRDLDLQGRCFLHSYDYKKDLDLTILTTILTAPMVVAQWINAQYLFSTLDNVAYGSGSKVTQNITSKIGVMQGNASDLMTGLPLQSVYLNDIQKYHEPQRLMTVVYCPLEKINVVVTSQPVLRKLFKNGWVQLFCIEPDHKNIYLLQRDLTWKKVD